MSVMRSAPKSLIPPKAKRHTRASFCGDPLTNWNSNSCARPFMETVWPADRNKKREIRVPNMFRVIQMERCDAIPDSDTHAHV